MYKAECFGQRCQTRHQHPVIDVIIIYQQYLQHPVNKTTGSDSPHKPNYRLYATIWATNTLFTRSKKYCFALTLRTLLLGKVGQARVYVCGEIPSISSRGNDWDSETFRSHIINPKHCQCDVKVGRYNQYSVQVISPCTLTLVILSSNTHLFIINQNYQSRAPMFSNTNTCINKCDQIFDNEKSIL